MGECHNGVTPRKPAWRQVDSWDILGPIMFVQAQVPHCITHSGAFIELKTVPRA